MLRVLFVSNGPLKKMPRETHYGIVTVRSVTPEIIDRVKGTKPDIVIICGEVRETRSDSRDRMNAVDSEVEQWVLDEIHTLNPDTILKR